MAIEQQHDLDETELTYDENGCQFDTGVNIFPAVEGVQLLINGVLAGAKVQPGAVINVAGWPVGKQPAQVVALYYAADLSLSIIRSKTLAW